jgi:alpha-N-arabinofuranosidase
MKKYLIIIPLAVLVVSSCGDKQSAEGSVTVDLTARGADIPSSMYGVFFEEINHAGDGGLYAELVQNRSFEDSDIPEGYTVKGDRIYPPPLKNHITGNVTDQSFRWNTEKVPAWILESKGDKKAEMELTRIKSLNTSAPTNLQLKIPEGAGEVALINRGYWGMGIREGEKYDLRFYMRTSDYNGNLTVMLVAQDAAEQAHSVINVISNGTWNEYKAVLKPVNTKPEAMLYLVFKGTGTVWIDYVSLFPENTFKNRPNGLRKDVAEFLAGLHPAFIRWPGGCIVEGISLINRVEWKKTLGDPAARPGQYDTWGYRNSYGFGYHEFLQYCEDIGARSMYVCNVGLGCQYRVGDACSDRDVQYYINDALDAVEYAIGDRSTTWGAKRAEAGHPEPFPLQYVEIGNENWGRLYNQRFNLFYKAIKDKYPQLTLISNHGLDSDMTGVVKTDMIDPHWYVEPDFFFNNTGIFDNQPRGDFLVYVGEYACNQKVGGGNMLAALSEAAFITGMERNSDLVRMASYAPLFENRHDRTWPVNLIWIDNLNVVGRSSYYVQKLMAENRPSWNIKTLTETGEMGKSGRHEVENKPDSLRQFAIGGYDKESGVVIIKVVNAEQKPWKSSLEILNASRIESEGDVITLSAGSLTEENSFEEPMKISPLPSRYDHFSAHFEYVFEPCSLTILRIKAE